MRTCKCDKCGVELREDEINSLSIRPSTQLKGGLWFFEMFDLCDDCYKLIAVMVKKVVKE